jgi:uncharacterized protein (DUF2235 family)
LALGETGMSKNIIFLADGTWNGKSMDKDSDGVLESTNVLRLYQNLAGNSVSNAIENEDEKALLDGQTPIQVAKYLHGVGDSDNLITKIAGGSFGAGLISRIVRGYTFISRNYEPGDNIYIAGFSRGAYTARALGGMIAKDGLLNYDRLNIQSKEEAYRYGFYVWASYREKRQASLASTVINSLWRRVISIGTPLHTEDMHREVPIAAIGVWDTVGAMGIPVYANENERADLFRFADTDLSTKVKRGFHAMALDEHRIDFSPTQWTPRDGIEQAWFVGSHSDVGGGYPETGLSDIALDWMSQKFADTGVLLSDPLVFAPQGDYRGEIHDSRKSLPWKGTPRIDRAVAPDASSHESVRERRNDAALNYDPAPLMGWNGLYVN